jgi:LPXTG-site transpeptidase (sortase) family protein
MGSGNVGWQERIRRLGIDRLTMILAAVAVLLAAAIAAICVDLWPRPEDESPVAQALAATEPARLTGGSPVAPAPSSLPSPTPSYLPSPLPFLTPVPAAVRLRIPAIGVDRSIVEVPLTYDSPTNTWQRDYDLLFRQGKRDLVGHYGGSASPGQPGNTILVGHNYGYGVNGVFVRLGRLEVGQLVEVVNEAGQSFTYRVTEVARVPWIKKNQQEFLKHQAYLSIEGPERLTLVTCGGSHWAPFPDRVYVVAEPVR